MIAVIGGGIGGLTLAALLQQQGVPVRVFERSRVLGEVGAGVTLAPNASKVLEGIGLGQFLAQSAVPSGRHVTLDAVTGAVLEQVETGDDARRRYGSEHYQVHRSDLHAALAELVRGGGADAMMLGSEFESAGQFSGGVIAQFADGSSIHSSALIGADGVRSVVRQSEFGPESPRYAGFVAWRVLVPATPDLAISDTQSRLYTGKNRTFLRYYLRGRSFVNVVAFTREPEWAEEGWSVPASKDDLQKEFEGWPDEVAALIAAAPADGIFRWGLFVRDSLPTWTNGRIALLGDAAHPMLPFLGQGAGMAIEDAAVLAQCIAEGSDIPSALVAYDQLRRPRATLVADYAEARGMYLHGVARDSDVQFLKQHSDIDFYEYEALDMERGQ